MNNTFTYEPSKWVPFRNTEVLEQVRKIRREDIENHPNPDYRIKVYKDEDIGFVWAVDMFSRIKEAGEAGKKLVAICPNPNPTYRHVTYLLNKFKIDCSHLHVFIMDEYADQDGNIAPENWKFGFMNAFRKYFVAELDKNLRPPENQIHGPTNENISVYSKMLGDEGGADICYSGPGWTGHLAFVDPDSPEYHTTDLEAFKQMGAGLVTLSPFTLAQNSLHGCFGKSGDLAMVPPRAATIGPKDVLAAKHRIQVAAISIHGTTTAWQRLIARLVMHGPPSPLVPESICQLARTDMMVSETIAQNIEVDWNKGY